uniref:hypothetical protein n=1 Tax=Reinekea sp. G2M2-21 TaxID=2788942 RepID=UPI001E2DD7F7
IRLVIERHKGKNVDIETLIERLKKGGEDRITLLQPAVAKAAEVGLLPKNVPAEDSIKHWDNLESVLISFLESAKK